MQHLYVEIKIYLDAKIRQPFPLGCRICENGKMKPIRKSRRIPSSAPSFG